MILLENKLDIFERMVFLQKEKACLEKTLAEKQKLQTELEEKEAELKSMKTEVVSRRINLAKKQGNELIAKVNENSRILKLQKDEELLEKLMTQLYKKLYEYVNTENYIELVKVKFVQITSELDDGKYILRTLKKDEKLLAELNKLKRDGLEFIYEELDEIEIGGFSILDENKTYTVDASLREKVQDSKYKIGQMLHQTLTEVGEQR